jgi:ATP phosphoribosyltransferase regulatory subunit HisZ
MTLLRLTKTLSAEFTILLRGASTSLGTSDLETDLSNAVAVSFIENIPLNKNVSNDMHRWMSRESFEGFEQLFRYHLSDEEYRQFEKDFLKRLGPADPRPRP